MAPARSYRQIVASQFKRNKLAVFSLHIIFILLFIFIFADFLANDKPIAMKYHGKMYFPVFREYAVDWFGINWQDQFKSQQFKILEHSYEEGDWAIYPVIPYSPNEYNLEAKLHPPSSIHLFGTDELGRDVMSQMIHGARVSLLVGFVAVAIYVFIGIILGALAGFYGGLIDIIIQRMIEIMITFPRMFLIITIVAVMETQSIINIMVILGLTGWTGVARFTRGEFLKVKNEDYVVAAKALGYKDFRTIFRHVLPNTLTPVLVTATFGVAAAILIESGLSFLGFGAPPEQATWGSLLSSARDMLPSGWWLTTFPGLAIFITVTVYNLVGEGLRDALDPRLKQ
ncbi:MAG: ABC transporter permease [Candidatus Marinimicrobia bacterium]|nr:ABC transporter permease [Candidatus Neomarinimicrobiota bacterium]MCF7850081.1 ABC transporter permease [Candidatus Neomarinimicrobiota bacterium]MCF7904831.1 ABC transporter permease [Candidatus Neomarinimicrobiota bacterium]